MYFAGRINPLSKHTPPFWREEMVWHLNDSLRHYRVLDASMIGHRNRMIVENGLPFSTLFPQSCYYIQHSDIVVVNLTDDISVGGSHEIFMAKQFGIPVIGLARRGGKFNKLKYELSGKTYWNWVHPFVGALCDIVVQSTDELTETLDDFKSLPNGGIAAIDEAVRHYQRSASALDTTINSLLSFRNQPLHDTKQRLRIYFAGKMGKAMGFEGVDWRRELTAVISGSSRFRAVNLDFLDGNHAVIDENDPKLIFGRDAYLIRSADVVIVALSDDISVGGSVEMMLAKLYQRPLVGIARPNGKFVNPERDILGRRVTGYINPFVAASCDWLVHDPAQLPTVIDELHAKPVKTHGIVSDAASWYGKQLLRHDKAAQLVFAHDR